MKTVGYHITPELNVRKILTNQGLKIDMNLGYSYLLKQETLYNTGRSSKMKAPGSLGYGLYTFVNGLLEPTKLCDAFANRIRSSQKLKRLEIPININDDNILDFTNTHTDDFRNFVTFCDTIESETDKLYKKFNVTGKNQFVWDGIATELFINYLLTENEGSDILAVERDTYTPIRSDSLSADKRITSNGYEFLIRDWSIVGKIKHYIC